MVRVRDLEKWLSTGQVAKILGRSRSATIALAERGELVAAKTGAGWIYDPKSVEDYREKRA